MTADEELTEIATALADAKVRLENIQYRNSNHFSGMADRTYTEAGHARAIVDYQIADARMQAWIAKQVKAATTNQGGSDAIA